MRTGIFSIGSKSIHPLSDPNHAKGKNDAAVCNVRIVVLVYTHAFRADIEGNDYHFK
ncbi:MAG: hypothetical protein A4E62_01762 [Syntrophorhabdus sp. PtaU1.Bin002]|nr:MAG: hypothetical protein A4E62_01762 [Syntrophorhabdus sp. PtaU1.Bin002]